MDNTRVSIINFYNNFITTLSSDKALHLYTWVAIALIFSMLIFTAFALLNRIKQFSADDFFERIHGPGPKRERTIKNRLKRMKRFASSVIMTIARNAAVLVLVGIILPGVMLGVIAAKQDWIMPGTYALSLNDVPTSGTQFAQTDLAIFVADQALKGGLSDAFEVFDVGLGNIRNNPENKLFSTLVLIYRLLSGAVAVTIAFVAYRIVIALPDIKAATDRLQKQLEDLQTHRAV